MRKGPFGNVEADEANSGKGEGVFSEGLLPSGERLEALEALEPR